MPKEDGVVKELNIRATPEHCRRRQCYPYSLTYLRFPHPQGIHQGNYHTLDKQEHGVGRVGLLPMESSWCVFIYGLLWKTYKVSVSQFLDQQHHLSL